MKAKPPPPIVSNLLDRVAAHGLRRAAREAGIPHATLAGNITKPGTLRFANAARLAKVMNLELVLSDPTNELMPPPMPGESMPPPSSRPRRKERPAKPRKKHAA